jgi:prepilin-type processing-associated H-X9-DG protein
MRGRCGLSIPLSGAVAQGAAEHNRPERHRAADSADAAGGDCFGTFHGDYKSSTGRGFGNLAFLDGHVSAISVQEQLRNTMHGGKSPLGPGGNLTYAWASETPPPGGWEGQ